MAYNTLQRSYLPLALTWIELSPHFVSVVAVLHRDTSCRFLVNGYHSRRRNVNCEIRQGSSLAPILFILALDSFYRVLEEREDIQGVPITSGGRKTELKFRDMPRILLSTFAIGLQLRRLSLFSMISFTCQVSGQTGRNQWSSSWTLAI